MAVEKKERTTKGMKDTKKIINRKAVTYEREQQNTLH